MDMSVQAPAAMKYMKQLVVKITSWDDVMPYGSYGC